MEEENDPGILSHAERLRLRSVPIFPLKSKQRPSSAVLYADIKPTVQSRANVHYVPGGGRSDIITYRTPNYKTSKSRIDSTHHRKTRSSPALTTPSKPLGTQRPHSSSRIPIRRPMKREIEFYDTTKYKHVKPKIDDKDPTPSIRSGTHSIDQLVEQEGFLLNPRFRDIAKSQSFDSVGQLLHCLNKKL